MVTDENGNVAIQHYNANGANIHIEATGHDYVFTTQYNVALAWVRPEDVNSILAVRTRVCCGKTGAKFLVANEMNVKIWKTGQM